MSQLLKRRIAVFGLGDIAVKAYLPIVANHLQIEPILCTRNKENLIRIASQYRITETYANLDELIEAKPDAIMVHSATISHYDTIKKILTARIAVFVDKPLSYSLEECNELIDLAKANQTLLYVGFNRRFSPFIQMLSKEQYPTQITWRKDRDNLPGDPRIFIFDDFIHVIDSLLFLGKGEIQDVQVRSIQQNQQLHSIQVLWQQNGTFIEGSMNRMSGYTQELVEYCTIGNTWQVNDFTTCEHFTKERQQRLNAASWDSALLKKGFQGMIQDWLLALDEKEFNTTRLESFRATHQLCEQIVNEVLKG